MSTGFHVADELNERSYDHALMRRLLIYIRPYRRWMFLATLLLLCSAVVFGMMPLLLGWAVDKYLYQPAGGLRTPEQIASDLRGILLVTLAITGLILTETLLRFAQIVIVTVIGQRTMLEMRSELFGHLQQMSLRFLDLHPVGRLMSRVTTDIEKIQQTIVNGVVASIGDLLTVVVILGYMFYLNWHLALIAISPLPFIFLTSYIFRKFARHSFLEIAKRIAAVNTVLQENIGGMRLVQLFSREREQFAQYEMRNRDHRDEWFRQVRNFAVYYPVIEFLGAISMGLIMLYTGMRLLDAGGIIAGTASVGVFASYVIWAERLYAPIRALADRYNLLLEAMAASERVFQLLDTPADILDRPQPRVAESLEGRVRFENVWFQYNSERWILKNVDFEVAPGERIAIVGHTGAGKSTMINILARFYDVQQGAIRIDGVDVRDYAQENLRRNIGIVLQDVFLFSGTIADNIRLGEEAMSMEHIIACARHVNADAFIQKLPGGYEYKVGERGVNLSTGQRQLIAFARTLAHDPRILVLDEATSSIDTETELLIQDAVEKLLAGRTSIVIAHRLSTIRNADRIFVMHHGELREQGTHEELLAHGGLYKTLYELQYQEQEA